MFTSKAEVLNYRPILEKEYVSRIRVYFWAFSCSVIGGEFFNQVAECQIFQKSSAPWGYCDLSTSISASSHIWKCRSTWQSASRGFPATDREFHSHSHTKVFGCGEVGRSGSFLVGNKSSAITTWEVQLRNWLCVKQVTTGLPGSKQLTSRRKC